MRKILKGCMVVIECVALLSVTGCSRDNKKLVVAKIDNRKITAGDLAAFTEAMPKSYRTKKVGLEGHKDHLQTLIDRELLLMEGEARGLDKKEDLKEQVQGMIEGKLLEEFERREISGKIKVTDEEARKRFEESELSRSVRIAHIVTKTKEDAQAAYVEIKAGRPFREVAKKWSVDTKTRDKGGDVERYLTLDKMRPELAEKIFSVKVGEVSEPIGTPDGWYEIVKVIDERPVDFAAYQEEMRSQVFERKLTDQWDAFVEERKVKLSPRLHSEVIPFLAQHWSQIETIAVGDDGKRVIYDYKGGHVTIRDLVRLMGSSRVRWTGFSDSTRLRRFVETSALPRMLVLDAAYRARLDRDQKIREWGDMKRTEVLIEALRKMEVVDRVQVTEEESRQEYEAHKMDTYSVPPTVGVVEILVTTEGEANTLLSKIRKGEDMEQLAVEATTREWAKKSKGIFHIHPFEKVRYGEEMVNAAFGAEVGQLVGPVKVKEGYSIFKVIDKTPQQPRPFEEVRKQVEVMIRNRKENEMFEQFVASLRAKYASKIRIDDDRLRKAAASGVLTAL